MLSKQVGTENRGAGGDGTGHECGEAIGLSLRGLGIYGTGDTEGWGLSVPLWVPHAHPGYHNLVGGDHMIAQRWGKSLTKVVIVVAIVGVIVGVIVIVVAPIT